MSSRTRASSTKSRNSKMSEEQNVSLSGRPPNEFGVCFDPCAATASYFLYAQLNVITILNHDTLTVDRKFENHKGDIKFIAADNVSEKGGGRQIASYDSTQKVIVWDLFTGSEFARFASYEVICVGTWMRDGNIAFGNSQGNIILFEPSTEEHSSTRTIFDPVTALAPASDSRTFAIGYKNGSILVATLQPSFTILHTLTTARQPSPITGLAWHGSSSKQKTDMLATQSGDGDLRVWTVSKAGHSEQPRVIRSLGHQEMQSTSGNWFAWSKNGRIILHSDGDTRAWDVRQKKMTSETVPTIDNVVALANFGPTGTLFTVGRNHTVQQYDLISKDVPVMVSNVQHVPPNAPPTPPDSIEDEKLPRTVPMKIITSEPIAAHAVPLLAVPIELEPETSEDEGPVLSPLQKIAQEMDDLEEERRDQLAPLSPISSRASMSSASSYGRPRRRSARSPTGSAGSSEGTPFGGNSAMNSIHDSMSIRSGSSANSLSFASRKDIMRSPDETKQMKLMDLFPFTKARLGEVKFRAPQYPQNDLSADVLRREMLSVVFGWAHDIESLIRDEQSRHKLGSASGILLSKWLGESGADAMANMVASESMTSADWMLLALTVNMGHGPQRQIGEAFVRRSLEANEIHPAVAILLGLGSQNEAIEVYVSRKYYLEAILLTCLVFPHDWKRQSHLVRKWGELAVSQGQPELAVRCFSCTGIEPSEPWFSPRSQDMVYQAQQQAMISESGKSPVSPPSAGSGRLTTKNASLKLITSFGDKGAPKPQETHPFGQTPISNSAITPGGGLQSARDQSQTRTATPNGYKKARLPSATRQKTEGGDASSNYQPTSRKPTPQPRQDTPVVRQDTPTVRQDTPTVRQDAPALRRDTPTVRQDTPIIMSSTEGPETAIEGANRMEYLPSPNPMTFSSARHRSKSRSDSKDRNHHQLHIHMVPTVETAGTSYSPSNTGSVTSRGRHRRSQSGFSRSRNDVLPSDDDMNSPVQGGGSLKGYKGRSIDRYIESLEEANLQAQQRNESRSRSRPGIRDTSRPRASSDVAYIKPSKRSPSSPKSMTAEDASRYSIGRDPDAAREMSSAVAAAIDRARPPSRAADTRLRTDSPEAKPETQPRSRNNSRNASRTSHHERSFSQSQDFAITYNDAEPVRAGRRSPPSPAPMESTPVARSRQRSASRRNTDYRARSTSRNVQDRRASEFTAEASPDMVLEDMGNSRPRAYSRKELAAKELEDRRLSLARRTPIPNPIPNPGEQYPPTRFSPRVQYDDDAFSTKSIVDGYFATPQRSHTVDPDALKRFSKARTTVTTGTSTSSVPIGLPATPRAMRHPRYMGADADDMEGIPAVPALPDSLTSSVYQSGAKEADTMSQLLPSTVYNSRPAIRRSVSTPPERYMGDTSPTTKSPSRGEARSGKSPVHVRQASERDFSPVPQGMLDNAELPNIGQTLNQVDRTSTGEPIMVVEQDDDAPPILAELAHLAGPPPPPPPPTMYQDSSNGLPSGVINIAIDGSGNTNSNGNGGKSPSSRSRHSPPTIIDEQANAPPRPASANPRSRHGSIDSTISSTKGASKWRNVADRMRNGSRSRNAARSPNPLHSATEATSQFSFQNTSSHDASLPSTVYSRNAKSPSQPAPYETVVDAVQQPPPPSMQQQSFSPTATAAGQYGDGGGGGGGGGTGPVLGSSVYRNPKEIRANMPPNALQQGIYQPENSARVIEGGMI